MRSDCAERNGKSSLRPRERCSKKFDQCDLSDSDTRKGEDPDCMKRCRRAYYIYCVTKGEEREGNKTVDVPGRRRVTCPMGLAIPSPFINKKSFLSLTAVSARSLHSSSFHSIGAKVLAVYIFILGNIGDPLLTMEKDDASAIRGRKALRVNRSVMDFHTAPTYALRRSAGSTPTVLRPSLGD